jgi:hypothetical protein
VIAMSILASASILTALFSYAHSYNKGFRAGNYAGELLAQAVAERDGWHAACNAVIASLPEEQREAAVKCAQDAYAEVRYVNLGGGE